MAFSALRRLDGVASVYVAAQGKIQTVNFRRSFPQSVRLHTYSLPRHRTLYYGLAKYPTLARRLVASAARPAATQAPRPAAAASAFSRLRRQPKPWTPTRSTARTPPPPPPSGGSRSHSSSLPSASAARLPTSLAGQYSLLPVASLSGLLSPLPLSVSARLRELHEHRRRAGSRQLSTSAPSMAAAKIDGTAIAKKIREKLAAEIAERRSHNAKYLPSLKIIQGRTALHFDQTRENLSFANISRAVQLVIDQILVCLILSRDDPAA
jgi:hypothetical protein